ncbi:glycosyltransferase family 2 protein [Streptococcus mitis]|uniref:glycosyltransferase family 2 protein n=1 Tax=Streptococcus mitis TaxID=28037 RepID=UPI0021B735E2|nr:glycosyltransferase family 2 protein [Streptococcus mitis]
MISVIVPVYNVEEYLEECLDSIQHQTYTDIEVILVNDGSRDGSQAICERYCHQDPRFHLINQENQGQSAARNHGVTASRGELITFVDSDDVISTKYLEVLNEYMNEDIDIVECEYRVTRSVFEQLKEVENIQIEFEGNSEEAVIKSCNYGLSYSPVCKLYRRHLVEDFPFLTGVIYEDIYHGVGLLKFIRKMVRLDYVGYYYREHSNSTMRRRFSEKNLDLFTCCDKLVDLFALDEKLIPYIGKFLVQIVTTHHKDFIEKNNPYQNLYEEKLREYIKLVEKSPEVARSSKMVKLYRLAPKFYLRYTFPIVNRIWRKMHSLKELIYKGKQQ